MSKRVSNKKSRSRVKPGRSHVRYGFWKRRQMAKEQEQRIKDTVLSTGEMCEVQPS